MTPRSELRHQTVMATVPARMIALAVAIKVVAGPIGQTAAIVAAILGPRPLQLAACAFGLFTAAVLLSTPIFGNQYHPENQGWLAGAVIYGVGWGIGLVIIL